MYNILTDEEVAHLFNVFKGKENDFIQHVAKALPDVIYVMNLDTYVMIYSSRIITLEIGYSAKEIGDMPNPILDVMHRDDRFRFLEHLQQIKQSKPGEVLTIEYRLVRRNGTIAWFVDRNTVFTRSVDGIPATKIGITHEITVRKEREEKMLRQESIMGQTEVLASTGSWEYDGDTGTFTWSKGMYRLFEVPESIHLAPSIYKVFSTQKDQDIAEKIVNSIETQQAFEELLHIQVNGKTKALKIMAAPIEDVSGSGKIVGVDMDVTKDEQYQQQLLQLNKDIHARNREVRSLHFDLQTLTQLTASDYKQNFKNIYTLLELVIVHDAEKLGNNGKANMRRMQSLLQKLNLMTDDVLSYLNLSQDGIVLGEHSLKNALDKILAEMAERLENAGAVVDVQVTGMIQTDMQLFSLLVHHLLNNAVRFHHQLHPLKILIRSDYVTIEDGNFLSLTIEDNGPGFEPEQSEKIFELFYKTDGQTPRKSSGVGLAIARKIMDLHHGMIQAQSTPGEGARFACFFPVS